LALCFLGLYGQLLTNNSVTTAHLLCEAAIPTVACFITGHSLVDLHVHLATPVKKILVCFFNKVVLLMLLDGIVSRARCIGYLDGSTGDLKESHLHVHTSLQLRRTMRYAVRPSYMFILLPCPFCAHPTVLCLQGASESKPLVEPHGAGAGAAAAEDKKVE
jgi:hypothetical protein